MSTKKTDLVRRGRGQLQTTRSSEVEVSLRQRDMSGKDGAGDNFYQRGVGRVWRNIIKDSCKP